MSALSLRVWSSVFKGPSALRLARYRTLAERALKHSEQLTTASTQQLRQRAEDLRWEARTGTPLSALLVEAYALVREAARRTLDMQHYPVQLTGGVALYHGEVAEMQTGEGKTLTAALPAFLRALSGKGCHVVTVNDYLARRDAEWIGPIYNLLGLTTGCIQAEMEDGERRDAYECDITYGTAKEFGFDFLRDRLRMGSSLAVRSRRRRSHGSRSLSGNSQPVQRSRYFALVDEADSVLIDEARTPLLIGLTSPNPASRTTLLRWSNWAARQLKRERDYVYEPTKRDASLTEDGCGTVLLMPKPALLDTVRREEFYHHVEQALRAQLAYQRDRDYVIANQEIMIVDESTGRMMHGRKWQEGLHQAVEAKESLSLTPTSSQAARITMQRFFRQYRHVAGMTGTAWLARRELGKSYGLKVTVIPTHRPCRRTALPPRIFATLNDKHTAVVEEIIRLHQSGRAVLVGTPSVAASEALGDRLLEAGIAHRILNAHFHEQEAEIVAQAGHAGRVTIATNMAGRGTDIVLDDDVRGRGGLHVIATEMHSSPRIDRQLVGRAARQGDPGSFQFFLSLEDELLRCLQETARQRLRARAQPDSKGELSGKWLKVFRSAQSLLVKLHRKQRKELLKRVDSHTETYQKMGLDPFTELADEAG